MEETGFDLIGLIISGGLSTYPLILGSVIGLAVVIDRLWALRGTERSITRAGVELTTALAHGDCGDLVARAERSAGVVALVLGGTLRALLQAQPGLNANGVAESRQFEALEALRHRLWILATIGSASPFVGLFGTVIGIMKSFHVMAQSGSGGFAVVAAGISEALVATALGLGVAIVAVAFYNYFEARLERIEGVLRIQTSRLLEAASAPVSPSEGH